MTTPDESSFLRDADSVYRLQHEVELDLEMIEASQPQSFGPASEWLVDPTEVERDEVALRSLLGAVEAIETDLPRPDGSPAGDSPRAEGL